MKSHGITPEGTNPTNEQSVRYRERRPNESYNSSSLCPTMPVLDALHAELGGVDGRVRGLFGLQHLFGSTASLLRTIADGRIESSRVSLLGKPYSANRQVVRFLRETLGYNVHPDSCEQPLDRDNDGEMDRRVATILASIRRRIDEWDDLQARVLLIDDGGRAIRLLHSDEFSDIRDRFTCVEQTRCGIRTIEDLDVRIPVVNVAESWVKLEHESPMIAESVSQELCRQLVALDTAGIRVGERALIIGYGAIGRAVSADLRQRGCRVAIHDRNEEQRTVAEVDGYPVYRDLRTAMGREACVILGCTGKPVFDQGDYAHIPDGAILVSASSADVEFRAWQLRVAGECMGRPEAWGGPVDATDASHPCFSLFRIANGGRRFYLVNGGFPVNFNGGIDPIPPNKIQLTRALLYLGALQASSETEPGIHELSNRFQHRLMDTFDAPGRRLAA